MIQNISISVRLIDMAIPTMTLNGRAKANILSLPIILPMIAKELEIRNWIMDINRSLIRILTFLMRRTRYGGRNNRRPNIESLMT
jgi:hypothetical protein